MLGIRFKNDFKMQVVPSVKDSASQSYVLKSCLSGDPLDIVKSVNDDINEMWTRLDDRYGKSRKLADAIMSDIKRLTAVTEGDDKRMVELVNVIENGYRELQIAGMGSEMSNTVFMSWIEEKLAPTIRGEYSLGYWFYGFNDNFQKGKRNAAERKKDKALYC